MFNSSIDLLQREWIFNKGNQSAPPDFGVCFSGGGNRSAAFAVGVLSALHEQDLLQKVDVISAVSGGSYALSWFLLQPFYHKASKSNPRDALPGVQEEMFDVDGPFQRYLADNAKPLGARGWKDLLLRVAISLPFDLVAFNALRAISLPLGSRAARIANMLNGWSSFRELYREGIQRTYQVFPAPEKRAPVNRTTVWDLGRGASDFLNLTALDVEPVRLPALSAFARSAGLPSFVFNATVVPPRPGKNVPLGHRVFEVGSMGFGSDSCGYLAWEDTENFGWEPGEPAEKGWFWSRSASPYATIRNFNIASAISGAAIDASPLAAPRRQWLLRLTNLGLAYLVPDPASRRHVVRLSDGGHSENLGLYPLIRRRCRNILVVDAEYDPSYGFGAYRRLRDAGIVLDIPDIERRVFRADRPVMEGTTEYGKLFYLKLSMDESLLGDQAEIVKRYAETHPDTFPQESTINQYFGPDRFRAYRALGHAITRTAGRDIGIEIGYSPTTDHAAT